MGAVQNRLVQDRTTGNFSESQAQSRLVDLFVSNYRIRLANSPELRNEAFRLRYKVYCEEQSFEPADKFVNRMESDSFDCHSDHFLIQELGTYRYVGTVRLVHSSANGGRKEIPIGKYCSHAFYEPDHLAELAYGSYAEISRLAVTSCSRINLLDTLSGKQSHSQAGRLSYSVASVALAYCALARFQLSEELEKAYTMMEPRLAVLLSRMGIKFTRVGRPIEYHGVRAPYLCSKNDSNFGFKPDQRMFFNEVYESVKQQLV